MELVKRNNSSNGLFPTLMEELLKPDWAGGQNLISNRTVPPVNIRETDNAYEVEVSVPGKKKEDFNIHLENDLLTISSQFSEDKTEDEGKYTRKEFTFSAFQRSFTLPETVKDDNIKASYEDGILKINLPKKEEALPKPKRTIEIL